MTTTQRNSVIYAITMTAAAALTSSVAAHDVPDRLALDPRDLSEKTPVEQFVQVRGHVYDATAKVWLMVRPPTGSCWLQGPANVEPSGDFSVAAQFGQMEHGGVKFAVWAVTNPPLTAKPGEVPCGLNVGTKSKTVIVTRR